MVSVWQSYKKSRKPGICAQVSYCKKCVRSLFCGVKHYHTVVLLTVDELHEILHIGRSE